MYNRETKKLNRRQARWSLYLSEFDIKLVHVPGTKMVLSDALSRRPDLCPEEDKDNSDVVVLPEHLLVNLIDVDLQERIANANELDADMANVLQTLLGNGPTTLQNDLSDWTTEEFKGKQILFYKGKNYIPKDTALRRDLIRTFHNHETAGHPGELETYNVFDNTIGGRDSGPLSRTTYRDAVPANSSKSTETPRSQRSYL